MTPRNHARYVDFLHGQVDELISNYGKVDVLWWDYSSTGYVHVFKQPQGTALTVPFKAAKASVLGGSPPTLVVGEQETSIILRDGLTDPIATVIRLEQE